MTAPITAQLGAVTEAFRLGAERAARLNVAPDGHHLTKLRIGDGIPAADYWSLHSSYGMTETIMAAYRDGFNAIFQPVEGSK